MADEYTPTTAEVREAYQFTGDGLDFKRAAIRRGQEFDRFLDGLVRAEAYATAAREIARLDARINEAVTMHASYHKAMVADRHGAERQQLVCDGCGNRWPCETYYLLTKDYD